MSYLSFLLKVQFRPLTYLPDLALQALEIHKGVRLLLRIAEQGGGMVDSRHQNAVFLEKLAVLLRDHVTYQEIARRTGASSATISRVNRALTYGADGYNRVLDSLDATDKE